MAAKGEVMSSAGKARVFGNGAKSKLVLFAGVLLISAGLAKNYLKAGQVNANVCAGSQTVHLGWQHQRDTMPIRLDCWSETLYIPHGVTYTIQGTPGGTEVCFWLNDRCAEIRTIGNGQNLDWGVYGPRDLAMRFRGGSGSVLAELTGHNRRRR